jgi:hypothetical protein
MLDHLHIGPPGEPLHWQVGAPRTNREGLLGHSSQAPQGRDKEGAATATRSRGWTPTSRELGAEDVRGSFFTETSFIGAKALEGTWEMAGELAKTLGKGEQSREGTARDRRGWRL